MAGPDRGRRLWGTVLIVLAVILAFLAIIGGFLTGYPMTDLVTVLLVLSVLCGIPAAIGAFLVKGANAAQPEEPGEVPPMSMVRIVFAVVGALVMLFSGGCALMFVPEALRGGGYADWPAIALFAGPPFLAGLLIWWLAAKAGRRARVPPP
jgi:uncharacterized membrane protein YdbT with pleckstrin-like domain